MKCPKCGSTRFRQSLFSHYVAECLGCGAKGEFKEVTHIEFVPETLPGEDQGPEICNFLERYFPITNSFNPLLKEYWIKPADDGWGHNPSQGGWGEWDGSYKNQQYQKLYQISSVEVEYGNPPSLVGIDWGWWAGRQWNGGSPNYAIGTPYTIPDYGECYTYSAVANPYYHARWGTIPLAPWSSHVYNWQEMVEQFKRLKESSNEPIRLTQTQKENIQSQELPRPSKGGFREIEAEFNRRLLGWRPERSNPPKEVTEGEDSNFTGKPGEGLKGD